jgi:hypothetical protein
MKRYTRKIGRRYWQMYQTGFFYRAEAQALADTLSRRIASGDERVWSGARVIKLGEYRFAVYVS